MKTALWWVRRDLRLSDNQALAAALKQAEQVVPVFINTPQLVNSPYAGEKRLAFLYEGLRALDSKLRQRGSYLVVRRGDPVLALSELYQEVGAESIFAEADYSPFARRRDQTAARSLPIHFTSGLMMYSPEAVLKAEGTPYTVFTPYSKAWLAQPWPGDPLPAAAHIPTPPGIRGEDVPSDPRLPADVPFRAGEDEAQRRLEAFAENGIFHYGEGRNRMDLAGTSGLSPYLRFGMLSARQAAATARLAEARAADATARRSSEAWLNELIWREFYLSIQAHFPETERYSFRASLRDILWDNDETAFAAWCQGQTGYPVVDAAMRQLAQTGWMHNRARMIVASFLVKDLLIDWRWGELWFMQHLVDADPAANNGGWQWTAGTGTDAAPYFRIFHPVLQGKKHDPEGAYVRQWVPELAQVPGRYIHAPWEMPPQVQRLAGCVVGQHYPLPIVDHAWARERVLAAYAQARKNKE